MKTICIWTTAILAMCLIHPGLSAATILTGQSVQIITPIEGNVYAGAGQVTVNAVINGDFTAGTGELLVLDTIRRDLTVGAGRVKINGVIGEDLRCGGGDVLLEGTVLGDVVVGSGSLEIGPNAVIYGDLVVGGGRVRVNGRIMGALLLAGGEIDFSGEAASNAEVRGGSVVLNGTFRGPCKIAVESLLLGPKAAFYRDVQYFQNSGAVDFSGHLREQARATFDPALKQDMGRYNPNWFDRFFPLLSVYRLLAGAALIALLVWLFDGFFQRSVADLPAQWLNRLGAGGLYFIGVPFLMVMLFVTVIGIPFGLFLLFLYVSTFLFAFAITATVGAYTLEQYRHLSWSPGQRILVAIGLLIGLKIATWVPVIGWLAILVAVCIAFGAVSKAVLTRG